MQVRTLGKTGLSISEMGFGGWTLGGNATGGCFGQTDDRESIAALNRAYDQGCTFFSTADVYGHGHSEALIGTALKGWNREQVVIATKGGQDFSAGPGKERMNFSEKHLRRAVEDSLNRLGMEAIDLYMLHNPTLELIQQGGLFQVARALKQEGKIRHLGITIHDPQEGIQAIEQGQVDVVETVYNLFDRRAEKALFDKCRNMQTGLIVREPLARGFLSGSTDENATFEPGDVRAVWPRPLIAKRVQAARAYTPLLNEALPSLEALALKFILTHPAVSSVTPDFRSMKEVESASRLSDLPPLSPEMLTRIDEIGLAIF